MHNLNQLYTTTSEKEPIFSKEDRNLHVFKNLLRLIS